MREEWREFWDRIYGPGYLELCDQVIQWDIVFRSINSDNVRRHRESQPPADERVAETSAADADHNVLDRHR